VRPATAEAIQVILPILFWILWILGALGGGFYWRTQPFLPGLGVTWLLLGILGWHVFGGALR
jgi:hypothetical protein